MLDNLQAQATADGRECVVGALITNPSGRVFAMQRSATRRLFPECWDIPGGHVEVGETLIVALAREIREETGWELDTIIALSEVFDWEAEQDGRIRRRREFDFRVTVRGDWREPRLETDKASTSRWIGPDDVEVLKESRHAMDLALYNLFKRVLEQK